MAKRSLPNWPVEITPPDLARFRISRALGPGATPKIAKTREKLADLSKSASSARRAGSESGG